MIPSSPFDDCIPDHGITQVYDIYINHSTSSPLLTPQSILNYLHPQKLTKTWPLIYTSIHLHLLSPDSWSKCLYLLFKISPSWFQYLRSNITTNTFTFNLSSLPHPAYHPSCMDVIILLCWTPEKNDDRRLKNHKYLLHDASLVTGQRVPVSASRGTLREIENLLHKVHYEVLRRSYGEKKRRRQELSTHPNSSQTGFFPTLETTHKNPRQQDSGLEEFPKLRISQEDHQISEPGEKETDHCLKSRLFLNSPWVLVLFFKFWPLMTD